MAMETGLHPKLPQTPEGQLLRGFIEAFDTIREQIRNGNAQPAVPLTSIGSLGEEGITRLKFYLEDTTQAQFAVTVNVVANAVTFTPLMPLKRASDVPVPATTSASPASNPKTGSEKVPRPPNAFIIYRKEWHPRIVAQNPGLHNNAISVIIGDQWRSESDEIRTAYKQKAEEAKRQHELDHPSYHYQPRKPSEKKKRMTKNKLAKLGKANAAASNNKSLAQQPLPDTFDPFSLLDETLAKCVAAEPTSINNFGKKFAPQQPTVQRTTNHQFAAFDAGTDVENRLRASLQEFNANVTPPPPILVQVQPSPWAALAASTHATQVSANGQVANNPPAAPAAPAAPQVVALQPRNPTDVYIAQQVADDEFVNDAQAFPFEYDTPTKELLSIPWEAARKLAAAQAPSPVTEEVPKAPTVPNFFPGVLNPAAAEVERQDILDEDFSAFIDLDAYTTAGPGDEDNAAPALNFDAHGDTNMAGFEIDMPGSAPAELNSFADAFELDFDDNTSFDL